MCHNVYNQLVPWSLSTIGIIGLFILPWKLFEYLFTIFTVYHGIIFVFNLAEYETFHATEMNI